MDERILFKVLLLVYKCVNGLAPAYLSNLLVPLQRERSHRSNSMKLLKIPKTRLKSYGDRSFVYAGPKEWKKLLLEIKLSPSVESFKTGLKTHLFQQCFKNCVL